jgi:hypothetical protein
MKKIYTLLLLLGIIQQSIFAQIENFEKIYIGNKINYGDFDFIDIINLNPCDYCPGEEQPLEDISFGYDIGAALTASALIQQARERALNQWFDRQHTVLKEEIERQLGQSFSNYNDARNTYFKFHERIGLQRNHTPIENKYNSRRLDKENKQSISLKNLKLLRLRENEIRDGNINNSSYGNFTYNGTSLDQIQSLSQLQNLWSNETNIFSDNNWKYQNDRRLYYTVRGLGGLQNYSHEIFTDLFNKQLAFYNQYDRWKQLDLMQAFLNEIRPPLALPAGYISPQTYATSQYIEEYAISKHLNTWSADMIFHPYYYQHTTVYQIWMAREGRQEAIERATAYVQGLRDAEINRLLDSVEIEDTYICECNCNSTEIEFTNDLENNMEPKWGQLANKQEILDEINKVNLNNLTFEQQIVALANHFEKHLRYDINSSDMPYIIDPSTDVNRYVYSEVGGWIDFHHVFKIFEWATQNGPFSAITQGELGEMWQSLKNNNSAYSYEDLPSNLLGVGMYVRFSQDLALGNITWHQAIKTALDEISCIEPESAPNFDYIPYIINEYYPKNYTYTPLLGEQLKQYHKQKFCERPLYEQQRTKQVHELFRR